MSRDINYGINKKYIDNLVNSLTIIKFKPGVATSVDLPLVGNEKNDARITNDDGHLHIWNGSAWTDQGDIIDLTWSALSGKPSSSVADIDDAVSKKHTQNTDAYLSTMVTNVLHVDNKRTDTYTPNGSITKPFLTIQDAIDYVSSLALAEYFTIKINAGIYNENLVLENAGLKYVELCGVGYVSINPSSGNALQSTTNNNNLIAFYLTNISFAKPVVLTGGNGAASFADVMFKDVNFTGTATLTASCINNISMKGVYSEQTINYVNVSWSNVQNSQLQGALNLTADSTLNIPSWGVNGTIQMFGSALLGKPTYVIGGTAAYTVAVIGSRWGSNTAITIPNGLTIYAYSSFIRGTVTNNGSVVLRASTVETYVAGTGSLTITAQPASQIKNDSSVTGATVKDALDNLQKNRLVINAQTNTTYTLASSDEGKVVTLENASPVTVTIETNSVVPFEIGSRIDLIQKGVGVVTIAGAVGVTIKSKDSNKSLGGQNVAVSLIKEDTDTWYLIGDLIA
jgi:hypothetical protein